MNPDGELFPHSFRSFFKNTCFVVLDVETTGLSVCRGGRVCEIGAVKVRDGAIVSRFSRLINPRQEMSPYALAVHGITDDMLRGAPTFSQVAEDLFLFMKDTPVAAYNAKFDVGFIRKEFELENIPYSVAADKVWDILQFAHFFLPEIRKFSLSSVSGFLGIRNRKAHRALSDAVAAWMVFYRMVPYMKSSSVYDVYDLLAYIEEKRKQKTERKKKRSGEGYRACGGEVYRIYDD